MIPPSPPVLKTREAKAVQVAVLAHRAKYPLLTREARKEWTGIGGAVRAIRVRRGTVIAFAKTMGVGQKILSELEQGARPWTDEYLRKFDDAMAETEAVVRA